MDHEVIVVGHSMMPKGTATREVHETLSMVVLVDRRTHQILRASVTALLAGPFLPTDV